MRGNAHVRFGGRAEETGQSKDRHRASVRPYWAILEDEFDCLLVNARHVKQVPGRKTDVSDAAWLCQLLEAGLLQRSFVPPKPIRALRNLTRYRKAQIGERQREANRLHKILEYTGIKLDCVATDILGVSGRGDARGACRRHDPAVLAELARGKLRKKIPALEQALVGRFDAQHALIVSAIPRSPRLPRRADRAALGRDRGAASPYRGRG